jgi:uncharacterized membrane protein
VEAIYAFVLVSMIRLVSKDLNRQLCTLMAVTYFFFFPLVVADIWSLTQDLGAK